MTNQIERLCRPEVYDKKVLTSITHLIKNHLSPIFQKTAGHSHQSKMNLFLEVHVIKIVIVISIIRDTSLSAKSFILMSWNYFEIRYVKTQSIVLLLWSSILFFNIYSLILDQRRDWFRMQKYLKYNERIFLSLHTYDSRSDHIMIGTNVDIDIYFDDIFFYSLLNNPMIVTQVNSLSE